MHVDIFVWNVIIMFTKTMIETVVYKRKSKRAEYGVSQYE